MFQPATMTLVFDETWAFAVNDTGITASGLNPTTRNPTTVHLNHDTDKAYRYSAMGIFRVRDFILVVISFC